MSPRVLLVSHGTRSAAGRAVVDALAARVRDLLPGRVVGQAYVSVQHPLVADAVAEALAGPGPAGPVIVVPLLLGSGYHVQVDIAAAVAGRAGVVATRPLGPDPALVPVLLDRLAQSGARATDTCVLVGAGSTRPGGNADVRTMAGLLARERPGPVRVAYCAAAEPSVPDAVTATRGTGRPAVVLPYLLAPGHFLAIVDRAGADRVAGPVGADPRVAALVAARVRAAGG